MSDDDYGPALPPSLTKHTQHSSSSSEEDDIGPALPPRLTHKHSDNIGPQLPTHLTQGRDSHDDEVGPREDDFEPDFEFDPVDDCSIGPTLLPQLQKSQNIGTSLPPNLQKSQNIGPTLPPKLQKSQNIGPTLPPKLQKTHNIGPALPPHLQKSQNIGPTLPGDGESSSEDEMIGPSLPLPGTHINSAAREVERRANAMKNKLTNADQPKMEREEWMLELPPDKTNLFGLEARQFRKKPKNLGDRSGWTETPNDEGKKKKPEMSDREVEEANLAAQRDREINAALQQHGGQKRKESLMDIHQKKLKQGEEDAPQGRQEFDRDRDLGISAYDPEKRAKIINKSKELGNRFSSGAQKYL